MSEDNKNKFYKKENLDMFDPEDVNQETDGSYQQMSFDFSEEDVENLRKKHLKEAEEIVRKH